MNKKNTIALLLLVLCSGTAFSQTVTQANLLQEIISFRSLSQTPAVGYRSKQASSYDRRSVAEGQPGWFANTDQNQYIRSEKTPNGQEEVMMEADGPGAVTRFWLTTQAKPGIIRFYLDHQPKPVIEIPGFDLVRAPWELGPALLQLHSSYEASGKGGNTLYLPIPYQQHCKITFQFTDSISRKSPHYYQVNYRVYAPETKVTTFVLDDLVKNKALIDAAENILLHPPKGAGKEVVKNTGIAAKKQVSFPLPKQSGAITQLSVQLQQQGKPADEKYYRSTWISIRFDGEETVDCPLGDFAGSGFGRHAVKSWYRDMDANGKLTSRWHMPYRKTAQVTIRNTSADHLDVTLHVTTVAQPFTDSTLYFHATYKQQDSVWDAKWDYDPAAVIAGNPKAPIEWNLIKVKGKGVYAGNTLAVDNLMKTWYGEGDAKVYVDTASFPDEFGTGLEDYYNTSWAPVVLYQSPFANAPRADHESSFGHNTFTRTRNLDAIPFDKQFRYDLEMLSWDGGYANVAATVYWYGAPGAKVIP